MLKMYGYFRSSAAFRLRIALALKGVEWEPVYVHLRKGEQNAAAYTALNPQGLVPTVIDGDEVMTQSPAILEWLEETHPEPPLLPTDAAGRARVRGLAMAVCCDIHPLNNLRVLNYLTGTLGHDEAARDAWYNHWVALGLAGVEGLLADDPRTGAFCHGAAPTFADICLVPQIFNARRFKADLAAYPTVMRVFDACMALPAFDEAQPAKQPDAE